MPDDFIPQLEDMLKKLRTFELVLTQDADREYLWYDKQVREFLGDRHHDLDDTALSYVLSLAMHEYDMKKGTPEGGAIAAMCWYLIGIATNKRMIAVGMPYQKKMNELVEENRKLMHTNEAQGKEIEALKEKNEVLGGKLLEVINKQDDLLTRYNAVYDEFMKLVRKSSGTVGNRP